MTITLPVAGGAGLALCKVGSSTRAARLDADDAAQGELLIWRLVKVARAIIRARAREPPLRQAQRAQPRRRHAGDVGFQARARLGRQGLLGRIGIHELGAARQHDLSRSLHAHMAD